MYEAYFLPKDKDSKTKSLPDLGLPKTQRQNLTEEQIRLSEDLSWCVALNQDIIS